jgi:putative transcriptional regulator
MRNRVRELRENAGHTQESLGKQLEVSRQTVISIESSRYDPSLKLALKIARVFNTTVEEVFLVDDPADAGAAVE